MRYLIPLILITSCATTNDVERVEQQMERKWYLYQCDLCDIYTKVGTNEHEQCIINATSRWVEIKRRRGWN